MRYLRLLNYVTDITLDICYVLCRVQPVRMENAMKITEALAIYAAVLSTFTLIWNIQKSIPKFKVGIGFGINDDGDKCESGYFISIRNPSSQTIHIACVSIMYQYEKASLIEKIQHAIKYKRFPNSVRWVHSSLTNYDIHDECPRAIEAGASHSVFVPERVIEEILDGNEHSLLKATVQDQLFRNRYSKSLKCH